MNKLITVLALAIIFIGTMSRAEGLPTDIPQGSLILKCYEAAMPKRTWRNPFAAPSLINLEKFRKSDTKYAFNTKIGTTIIETYPAMILSDNKGVAVDVTLTDHLKDVPKFDIVSQGFAPISKDGNSMGIVGPIPGSNDEIKRLAICGLTHR